MTSNLGRIRPVRQSACDAANERLKRRVVGISNPALRVLMSAPWRGNVRELENVLERAMLLADGDVIGVEHLSTELAGVVE
jgi:DNA-binding NtrC family response regulator